MTWFERLFGFRELAYDETKARFEHNGDRLRSLINGRDFGCGEFSTPSLSSLRQAAKGLRPGRLTVRHEIIGDVLELHARPENAGAMFQVASQFNCLEFAGPEELPEDGVTQYDDDPTQGPACSLAAGAATVVRNYFIDVGGESGQRRDRQLNNLDDVLAKLGRSAQGVEVRNGYTFAKADTLRELRAALTQHDREELMGLLKIGLQTNVEVTFKTRFEPPDQVQSVSQAFCSALSCGYAGGGKELWEPLATLVLDAAYEATLWAAIIDAERGNGSGTVWLTFLGGGAFGNERSWIAGSLSRALRIAADRALDVRIAHYGRVDEEIVALIDGR